MSRPQHHRAGSEPPSKLKYEQPPPTPYPTISESNNSSLSYESKSEQKISSSCFPEKRLIEGYFYYYNNFNQNFKKKKLMYFVVSNNFILGALNKNSSSLAEVISIDGYHFKNINNNTSMLDIYLLLLIYLYIYICMYI